MIRAGTLPWRKPGTLICWAIVLYAASRLGLSSSKGTSTVSLARVGLKVSTALFTGGSPCSAVGGQATGRTGPRPRADAPARPHTLGHGPTRGLNEPVPRRPLHRPRRRGAPVEGPWLPEGLGQVRTARPHELDE